MVVVSAVRIPRNHFSFSPDFSFSLARLMSESRLVPRGSLTPEALHSSAAGEEAQKQVLIGAVNRGTG